MKGPGSSALGGRWGMTAEVVGTLLMFPCAPAGAVLVLFRGILTSHVRVRFCLDGLLSHVPWAVRGAVEICGRIPSSLIFVFVPALRVHNVKWMPE